MADMQREMSPVQVLGSLPVITGRGPMSAQFGVGAQPLSMLPPSLCVCYILYTGTCQRELTQGSSVCGVTSRHSHLMYRSPRWCVKYARTHTHCIIFIWRYPKRSYPVMMLPVLLHLTCSFSLVAQVTVFNLILLLSLIRFLHFI